MAFPWAAIGTAVSIGSSIYGAIKAKQKQTDAEGKERIARNKMNRLQRQWENLDTSNPFLNLENTMEDLTINQKAAEFERQQVAQTQANILSGLRGAAGGSGIATLAQSLARQGQIAAQSSAARIAQQETANEKLKAMEAKRIQGLERQGELMERGLERQKVETMFGMSQQEVAARAQQAGAAQAQFADTVSTGVQGAASMFAGFGGGERPLFGLGSQQSATPDWLQSQFDAYGAGQGSGINAQIVM
jgi:Flp pilus assembly CpaE family ATPase